MSANTDKLCGGINYIYYSVNSSLQDTVLKKLGTVMKNFHNSVKLLTLQGVEEIPLFQTLSISTFGRS